MKWGWLILKLILVVICAFGGYLIAVNLNNESLASYSWAPWAGLLAGMIVGIAGLGVEKVVKHIPLKVLAGGTLAWSSGFLLPSSSAWDSPPSRTPRSTLSSI